MRRHAEVSKVSSKGQVVIPKAARVELDWRPGDRVTVEVRGDSVVLRKLSLEDILREAEEDWREGRTVTLWPKKG